MAHSNQLGEYVIIRIHEHQGYIYNEKIMKDQAFNLENRIKQLEDENGMHLRANRAYLDELDIKNKFMNTIT